MTEYRKYSHGQNIVDRLIGGYGWETRWHRPELDVISLYVDQFPESDLSRERVERHPDLAMYPTIAEALTLGGDRLAVDGVLIIAEHGNYPLNEKGQTLYPRYEFFQQTVEVFRNSGRSVPVFLDKHLSWNWDRAREMVEISYEMDFPFMAGSSVPVGIGGIDSYCIHSLEGMQSQAERRRGGETGVVSVQGLRGDSAWRALDDGAWDPALFEACLCRSLTLTPADESNRHTYPTREELPQILTNDPVVYRIEYADGMRATMLLMESLVRDITVAARVKDRADPFSLLFYLGAGHQMQPNFFNPLCQHIENLIINGQTPYPIERTLLTTGMTASGVESLFQAEKKLATPHLDIHYQVGPESTFRRT